MQAILVLQIFLSYLVGGVFIWSALGLSRYVKPGKSAGLAFTIFWIFNPDWFTDEGQSTFLKERRRVLLALGACAANGLVMIFLLSA